MFTQITKNNELILKRKFENNYEKYNEYVKNIYKEFSKSESYKNILSPSYYENKTSLYNVSGITKTKETLDELDIKMDLLKNSDLFQKYILDLNIFSEFYIISKKEYAYEIISSYLALSDNPYKAFKYLMEKSYDKGVVNSFFELSKEKRYCEILFNKLKHFNNLNLFSSEASKDFPYLSNISTEYDLRMSLEKIYYVVDHMIKNEGNFENIITSDAFEIMDSEAKMKFLEKYNENVKTYNIEIFKTSNELSKHLGINSIFSAETETISYISDKYDYILKQFDNSDSSSCRLLKTVLYTALYMMRNDFEQLPFELMKRITDVNSSWATGTAKTMDPSFYGNSDPAKAFYGYYNFMTGKSNPYIDIMRNQTVNRMDENAVALHRYFKNENVEELIYNMIFGKTELGESIYDLVSNVKEVIDIIEQPINASSLYNDMLSNFQGIVSSLLNSALAVVDFGLSASSKSLFNTKFIPIGGNKYSIADIYNYAVFLKVILSAFGEDGQFSSISRSQFIESAYTQLGINQDKIKEIGYCSYDRMLNTKLGMDTYDSYLEKDEYGLTITAKSHMKTLYSIIQFAIQKQNNKKGLNNNVIDYSNYQQLKTYITLLDENEIYFVLKSCGVNFEELNSYTKFTKENILEFNEHTYDITYVYNHDSSSTSFYKAYEAKDKEVLIIEKQSSFFNYTTVKKLIEAQFNLYRNTVYLNANNIKNAMFDSNGISDIDDFLMRFLPSIVELSKTLGIKTDTIKDVTNLLDYFCTIIMDLLFKEIFFNIKKLINDKLMAFSENMFKTIDKYKMEDVIVRFDINGSSIKSKLDDILLLLEKGIPFSKVLHQCFSDEMYQVKYDSEFSDIFNSSLNFEKPELENEEIENEEDDSYVESESVTLPNVENIPSTSTPSVSIPENPFKPSEIPTFPTDSGTLEDIILNDKTLTDLINKPTVSVDEMDIIKDKIVTVTNGEIVNSMNKIEKLKNLLDKELVKAKPVYSTIKQINGEIRKEESIIAEIKKEKNTTIFGTDVNSSISGEDYNNFGIDSVFEEFKNKDYNLKDKVELLEKIEEIVISENMPLTNFEIIQLLK